MSIAEILALAGSHIGKGNMMSSAMLCLTDAISLYDSEDFASAKERALKSLAYSVGVFHPDYKKASL